LPDLATHLGAAWLAGRGAALLCPISPRAVYLFTLGSALPDLLARAPHLAFTSSLLERATRPLHTPAALLLVCFLAAFLFEERGRARVFAALALGALLHCLLDFCQEIGPGFGYGWFYPLSDFSPQLPLFSADETVLYLPYLLGSALLVELLHRLAGRRGTGRRGRRPLLVPLAGRTGSQAAGRALEEAVLEDAEKGPEGVA
jgi:membrane-bound metal-dependent hydrolase YbcI (DUF457 family)